MVLCPAGLLRFSPHQLLQAKPNYTAPLTSFCWSTVDPSWIVTSSIDTTCTIWDISTNTAVTQLM